MTNATNAAFPVNTGNLWDFFGYEAQNVNEPRMWGFRLRYHFSD